MNRLVFGLVLASFSGVLLADSSLPATSFPKKTKFWLREDVLIAAQTTETELSIQLNPNCVIKHPKLDSDMWLRRTVELQYDGLATVTPHHVVMREGKHGDGVPCLKLGFAGSTYCEKYAQAIARVFLPYISLSVETPSHFALSLTCYGSISPSNFTPGTNPKNFRDILPLRSQYETAFKVEKPVPGEIEMGK